MGTWGAGLYENDDALDAQIFLRAALGAGKSAHEAVEDVLRDMGVEEGEELGLRLVLANELLELGVTSHSLFDEAREIIVSGREIEEEWKGTGASEETIKRREAVLQELLARLPAPRNPGAPAARQGAPEEKAAKEQQVAELIERIWPSVERQAGRRPLEHQLLPGNTLLVRSGGREAVLPLNKRELRNYLNARSSTDQICSRKQVEADLILELQRFLAG